MLYVVEQTGRVLRLARGRRTVFLDLRSTVDEASERGLLGLAFHPRFPRDRRFYVGYTTTGRNASWHGPAPHGTVAVPSSRRISSPSRIRTRTTTAATSRSAVTASCTRRSATEARAATLRTARRTPIRCSASCCARPGRRRSRRSRRRPPQCLAIHLRPRQRRPLHRRRRPERGRGGRLHARHRGWRTTGGTVREGSSTFEDKLAARAARGAGRRVRPRRGLHRHRRLCLPGHGRAGGAATSLATTARDGLELPHLRNGRATDLRRAGRFVVRRGPRASVQARSPPDQRPANCLRPATADASSGCASRIRSSGSATAPITRRAGEPAAGGRVPRTRPR